MPMTCRMVQRVTQIHDEFTLDMDCAVCGVKERAKNAQEAQFNVVPNTNPKLSSNFYADWIKGFAPHGLGDDLPIAQAQYNIDWCLEDSMLCNPVERCTNSTKRRLDGTYQPTLVQTLNCKQCDEHYVTLRNPPAWAATLEMLRSHGPQPGDDNWCQDGPMLCDNIYDGGAGGFKGRGICRTSGCTHHPFNSPPSDDWCQELPMYCNFTHLPYGDAGPVTWICEHCDVPWDNFSRGQLTWCGKEGPMFCSSLKYVGKVYEQAREGFELACDDCETPEVDIDGSHPDYDCSKTTTWCTKGDRMFCTELKSTGYRDFDSLNACWACESPVPYDETRLVAHFMQDLINIWCAKEEAMFCFARWSNGPTFGTSYYGYYCTSCNTIIDPDDVGKLVWCAEDKEKPMQCRPRLLEYNEQPYNEFRYACVDCRMPTQSVSWDGDFTGFVSSELCSKEGLMLCVLHARVFGADVEYTGFYCDKCDVMDNEDDQPWCMSEVGEMFCKLDNVNIVMGQPGATPQHSVQTNIFSCTQCPSETRHHVTVEFVDFSEDKFETIETRSSENAEPDLWCTSGEPDMFCEPKNDRKVSKSGKPQPLLPFCGYCKTPHTKNPRHTTHNNRWCTEPIQMFCSHVEFASRDQLGWHCKGCKTPVTMSSAHRDDIFKTVQQDSWCIPETIPMFCYGSLFSKTREDTYGYWCCRGCGTPVVDRFKLGEKDIITFGDPLDHPSNFNSWCLDEGADRAREHESRTFMDWVHRALLLEVGEKALEGSERIVHTRVKDLLESAHVAVVGAHASGAQREGSEMDILVILKRQPTNMNGEAVPGPRGSDSFRAAGFNVMLEDMDKDDWLSRDLCIHATGYARWVKGEMPWRAEDIQWDEAISRKQQRIKSEVEAFERTWAEREEGNEYRLRFIRKIFNEMQRLEYLVAHEYLPPTALLNKTVDLRILTPYAKAMQAITSWMKTNSLLLQNTFDMKELVFSEDNPQHQPEL